MGFGVSGEHDQHSSEAEVFTKSSSLPLIEKMSANLSLVLKWESFITYI